MDQRDQRGSRPLRQHGMPFEFLGAIEQIPVGSEFSANDGIAKGLGDIHHFGVEVADPLHLVVGIESRRLHHGRHFGDDIGVDPFALEFGNNGEDDAGKMPAGAAHL